MAPVDHLFRAQHLRLTLHPKYIKLGQSSSQLNSYPNYYFVYQSSQYQYATYLFQLMSKAWPEPGTAQISVCFLFWLDPELTLGNIYPWKITFHISRLVFSVSNNLLGWVLIYLTKQAYYRKRFLVQLKRERCPELQHEHCGQSEWHYFVHFCSPPSCQMGLS